MFLEVHNCFSNEECDEISSRCGALIQKNKMNYELNREGNTVQFPEHPKIRDLWELISKRLMHYYFNKVMLVYNLGSIPVADSGIAFHRYKPGDKLYNHADEIFSRNSEKINPRLLSVVVCLTDNEDSELVFPRQNKKIKTEKGKLICFLPNNCFEHYMNNNSNKDRDVLVTWVEDKSIECALNSNIKGMALPFADEINKN